jgi:hypothetical protein
MERPCLDLEDQTVVGDAMQMVWMDTDVELLLDWIVGVCAESKYSLQELEAIL